jgi:hypothetical protein
MSCYFCGIPAGWTVYRDPQHSDPPFSAIHLCDSCRVKLRRLLHESFFLSDVDLSAIVVARLMGPDAGSVEPLHVNAPDPLPVPFDATTAIREAERLLREAKRPDEG